MRRLPASTMVANKFTLPLIPAFPGEKEKLFQRWEKLSQSIGGVATAYAVHTAALIQRPPQDDFNFAPSWCSALL
jgi:hypothetical protein